MTQYSSQNICDASSHNIACHECDLLLDLPEQLDERELLSCPRCHHTIIKGEHNPIEKLSALAISAIVLLLISNSFPFLAFEAKGQSHSITLYQAAFVLFDKEFFLLAALVFCFIILLPLIYLGALLAVVLPLQLNVRRKAPIFWGLLIERLLPWSMAEVFLLGVLVALIKIVAMANIIFGISFWSYIAFCLTFLAIASTLNSHWLWHWIEHGQH